MEQAQGGCPTWLAGLFHVVRFLDTTRNMTAV